MAAEDDIRPQAATRHLMEGLATVIEQFIAGTYTSSGQDSLLMRQPLVLGGSTDAAAVGNGYEARLNALGQKFKINGQPISGDQALALFEQLYNGFDSLSEGQQKGVGIHIGASVRQEFKVDDQGNPVMQADNERLSDELRKAKDDMSVAQAIIDRYNRITDPAVKSLFAKACANFAAGQVAYDRNGDLTFGDDHPLVLAIADLMDHMGPETFEVKTSALGSKKVEYTVVKTDALAAPTKATFFPKKP